jgi:phosphoglycerate kinase
MNQFKTLDDLQVRGKKILLRTDMNVPMRGGVITDVTRIERTAPTIIELAEKGAIVIVLSHFGRPKGQVVAHMSLSMISDALSRVLNKPETFADNCIGQSARDVVDAAVPGDVVLLENLRFHAGEEANDGELAAQLAALGDIYVNDAFSCAHRAHASTVGVAHLLPAAAGRLMQGELEALEGALGNPQKPVAAIIGGAKVSSKMAVLGNLIGKVDMMVIGGGMANTFLYANGIDVGSSLCEKDMAQQARDICARAEIQGCEIILPYDAVVANEFKAGAASATTPLNIITADAMILDVGIETINHINARLATCKTVLWNGPLGAFEIEPFDGGTNAVAQFVACQTKAGALLSVAGGGDTVSALANAGVVDDFSYVSSAGGAFLEWLEGRELPGVTALKSN